MASESQEAAEAQGIGSDPIARRLATLLQLRREERFLEYKQSARWGDLKAKIARTALGMANIRDGGTLLIGVTQQSGHFVPEGMLDEYIETYSTDDIQAYINRFADPYVRTELHPIEWDSKNFLAVVVHEFDEIPIVCKADLQEGRKLILRAGAIYTRPYRMIETSEVRSQTEIREILDMATEKKLRAFLQMTNRVGIPLTLPATPSAEQLFQEQLRGVFP